VVAPSGEYFRSTGTHGVICNLLYLYLYLRSMGQGNDQLWGRGQRSNHTKWKQVIESISARYFKNCQTNFDQTRRHPLRSMSTVSNNPNAKGQRWCHLQKVKDQGHWKSQVRLWGIILNRLSWVAFSSVTNFVKKVFISCSRLIWLRCRWMSRSKISAL